MSVAIHNADSCEKPKKNALHFKFERLYSTQYLPELWKMRQNCLKPSQEQYDIHQNFIIISGKMLDLDNVYSGNSK